MRHSLKDQLRQTLRTSLKKNVRDVEQVRLTFARARPSSLVEALSRPLLQPLPQFFRKKDRTLGSPQQEVFGFYALRTAIRGYLIGLLYLQAADREEGVHALAPALALHYTAAYHALIALLALRGRTIVDPILGPLRIIRKGDITYTESDSIPDEPGLIMAKLTARNSWVFEPRRKSHEELWLTLIELMARRDSAIPEILRRWFRSELATDARRVDKSGAIKKTIRDIVNARHQALYEGYAYDVAENQGTGHALGYKAKGFRALAAGLLSSVALELDDLLYLEDVMPKGPTRNSMVMGILTPPFEMPDLAIPDGTEENLGKLSRLFDYLSPKPEKE